MKESKAVPGVFTSSDDFEQWMHEIARRREIYKKKKNLLRDLDQAYLKRLSDKLNKKSYQFKKKNKKLKKKIDKNKRVIYDKFSRSRKRQKAILDK